MTLAFSEKRSLFCPFLYNVDLWANPDENRVSKNGENSSVGGFNAGSYRTRNGVPQSDILWLVYPIAHEPLVETDLHEEIPKCV